MSPLLVAQPFSSGSDGSYGPLNITAATTLDLPPNGIFNCTTITIAPSVTLKFNKNALNTPVYLLATGDVTIKGYIDVSGKASSNAAGGESGPGGFNGGTPGSLGVPPGSGYGPGAGRAGVAGTGTQPNAAAGGSYGVPGFGTTTNLGSVYGSALLIPLVGGSGGGGTIGTPGGGGGGGGGAILIASSTRIDLTGSIYAHGGSGNGA